MWRSRARALFSLRFSLPRNPPPPQFIPKTLTRTPTRPRPRPPFRPFLRSFSSSPERLVADTPSAEVGRTDDNSSGDSLTSPWEEGIADTPAAEVGPTDDNSSGDSLTSTWEESVADTPAAEVGPTDGNSSGDSLTSLWEEGVDAADADDIFSTDTPVTDEEVDRVRSAVESTPIDEIETKLDNIVVDLSEELLFRVMDSTSDRSGMKLVRVFIYAFKNNPTSKSLRNVDLLVSKISGFDELVKLDVYMLWDLIKVLGKEKEVSLLSTGILNRLIEMFWRIGKAKAGLEVFKMFDEFGCSPDGDSYYFTVQALEKRSMVDAAWGVCEKMIKSGSFPDGEKVGEIVTFFCKGKKVKEAHEVYLAAREKKAEVPTLVLDLLVGALARNGETVGAALELLQDYQGGSVRSAGKSFVAVIHGLCKNGDWAEAKKVLMRMVNLGPAPGSAAFNFVITALSKAGEIEDAMGLMRVMESRGLRPDVYTYNVIMSGYTKGGMMDEAHKLLREAKKKHPNLSRVTYHTIVRGYCKMEEFEKALECLKEMKEDGVQPNMDEYNKLIKSLCLKAMDWRGAEKLLKEMEENGLRLKGTTRSLIAAVKELEEEAIQSITSDDA